jgi:hypothetical protein
MITAILCDGEGPEADDYGHHLIAGSVPPSILPIGQVLYRFAGLRSDGTARYVRLPQFAHMHVLVGPFASR